MKWINHGKQLHHDNLKTKKMNRIKKWRKKLAQKRYNNFLKAERLMQDIIMNPDSYKITFSDFKFY